MCLNASVGKGGRNAWHDVRTVQLLLNMNLGKLTPLAPVSEDGRIGPGTIRTIEEFQRRCQNSPKPDGRVDPGGSTLNAMRDAVSPIFDVDVLQGIMIYAKRSLAALFLTPLIHTMATNGIDSALRKAHFLAQLAHESGDLRYREELASGDAYEGRVDLGNTKPGDGRRFKGRGLIQLTGRRNYESYGTDRGETYNTDATVTKLATDPELAADVAGWFWAGHDLNKLADLDDLNAITRKINGGNNGLADRKAHLARAKFFLSR